MIRRSHVALVKSSKLCRTLPVNSDACRILRNAGYLPSELEQRREAMRLCDLLAACRPHGDRAGEASLTTANHCSAIVFGS